jgi:hypothetical protein
MRHKINLKQKKKALRLILITLNVLNLDMIENEYND